MFRKTRIGAAAACVVGGLTLNGGAVWAQDSTQRVEITGSAIKRIDVETVLPVTIVTKEEIARAGVTTAAELLDRISANNGGGYNQVLAIGDGARPGFAGASLRGLGSNTTLVLLNGRRLAVHAFDGGGVDLNSIAIGAIERVEVLRDGASALYGTDAIAGVINFITRRDFSGIELTASHRSPQSSGGKDTHGSVTAGFGDPAKTGFNIFGNLTYDKFNALKASEREFAKTSFLPNAPGGRFDRTSGNTIPASITVPGVGTVNPGVPNCLPPASFQTTPTGACRFDYASVIDILAPQEKIGGLVRGTLQLGSNNELFAEYNKTRTTTTFVISPTPASSATTFNGDPVLYPAGGRWYPKAINPATGQLEDGLLWYASPASTTPDLFVPLAGNLDVAWRTLDGGGRANESVANQDRLVLGAKGTILGKWDYDAAVLKATSKVTESYVGGLYSETRLLNSTCAVGSGACGPLNPTYVAGTLNPDINPFGLNDAVGLAALRAAEILEPVRISKSTRESIDGKISGELMQLPAGALQLAVGAERRKEKFDDEPLPILGTGDIIGGGGNQAPIHGSRTVTAFFGELVIPVLKGVEGLVQLRTDKYSDFGTTTNPKVGIRWQVTPNFLVRASAGTGFRAPTLPDLLGQITQTNTGNNYNDPYYEASVGDCYDAAGNPTVNFNVNFCNAQLRVLQGGNPALKPEESKQKSIGLVFQVTKDISVGVDYWQLKMSQQLGFPGADTQMGAFLAPLVADPTLDYDPSTAKLTPAAKAALNGGLQGGGVFKDPTTGFFDYVSNQISNVTSSDISGVDVSVNALLARTSFGDLRGTFEGTYIKKWEQNGTNFVGQYATFGPVVRWKSNTTFDLTSGPWNFALSYRQQNGYRDQGDTRDVGSYELFDLAVAYTGVKNLTLRAGIQNLMDRDPPYSRQGDYFHVGYDPTYADPRGRTFTVGASYKF